MDPGSSRTSRVSRSRVAGRGRTGFEKTAFLHYSAVPAFIPALSIHGQKSLPPTRGHGTGPLRSRARGAAATSRRVRRSEEGRVGKECVRPGSSRGSTDHKKKKN